MKPENEVEVKPLTQRQVWSYGMGALGAFCVSCIIGQLSFFYTDKVGLSAAAAGSMMLIAKIADAFTDLVMGHIVDRTKSRHGKARPWMLWMILPMLLSAFLLMMLPENLSNDMKFLYALVTNIFASAIICTAINVPYTCLLVFAANSTVDRTRMTVRQSIVQTLVGAVITVGLIPMTNLLGGTQTSWLIITMGFAGLGAIGMLLCFFNLKERKSAYVKEEVTEEEKVSVSEGAKSLIKNKYWIIMLFVILFAQVMYTFSGSTGVYYAKWIFGDENLVAIMGAIGMIPTVIGFFAVTPIINKFGILKVERVALFLTILTYVVKAIFPYNFWVFVILGGIGNATILPFNMTYFVLQSKVCDYHVWNTGKKMEGMINSSASFGAKAGGGIGAGIIGIALGIAGYESAAAVQSTSALNGIIAVSTYLPMIILIITLVLLLKFDLFDKYPQFK